MSEAKHYMTKQSDGLQSVCGLRSYQIGLSTLFTNLPHEVNGKCKVCLAAARKEVNHD